MASGGILGGLIGGCFGTIGTAALVLGGGIHWWYVVIYLVVLFMVGEMSDRWIQRVEFLRVQIC